ncbi:MAG TPA: glycoside hydrolase family 2 TIM barrel-domain containing protein [Solirubrobacteraceae bacterium]|nr:glycoside hydrolase family 2 TIM barrel-domain containing protein [Solirubrobacteraceae bacterium]
MTIAAALVVALGLGLGESRALVPDAPRTATVTQLRDGPLHHDFVARQAGGGGLSSGAASSSPIGPSTANPAAAIPLDGGSWESQQDPSDVGISQSWGQGGAPASGWSPVSIPTDFNPTVEPAGYKGQVWWYQTTFTGPSLTVGRGWDVSFESIRRNATVYLNGYEIGQNHNPYAPFSLPATSLIPGKPNTLIIRVDDIRGGGSFPEDWWNWGGIMGPVSLTPVGRVTFQNLGVTPELRCSDRCGDARVQGTLVNNTSASLTPKVLVHIVAPSGSAVNDTQTLAPIKGGQSAAVSFPVTIHSPVLWSPSNPALYTVQVKTMVGSRVEEQDTQQIGLRSVTVSKGILYLNGKRLWLHGAAIHEDTDGQGAALTDADIQSIVSELKAVGANITRAHYQLSPRLLDALDQAGIMVWAQPPVDHADAKLKSAAGRGQALSMLRSTVLADRNHPSVVVDSVANELSSTPSTTPGTESYLESAIKLTRQLNPSVPVALDIYGYTNEPAQPIYKQFGVLGFTDYFGWDLGPAGHSIANFSQLQPFVELQHSRYPSQALVISEYGAEAFYDGPVTTKGTYEFQSNYLQETYRVLDRLTFMNGSIYWTLREFAVNPGWTGGAVLPQGYTPDGIHHKGLLAYDGTPKPAFAVAQQLFAQVPGYVTNPKAYAAPKSPTPKATSTSTNPLAALPAPSVH